MKTIYLITQKILEVDTPEYLQNHQEFPLYAVNTLDEVKKELQILRKQEEERFQSIKNSLCRWQYDYRAIALYGKKKAAH